MEQPNHRLPCARSRLRLPEGLGGKRSIPSQGMKSRGLQEFWGEFCCGTASLSHLCMDSAEVLLHTPQAPGRAKDQLLHEPHGSSVPEGKGWGVVRHDTLNL